MATSQKLTDQFLTCAVCFEVFIDPVTLECQHTFCRKCVICFTKSQPDAVAAKSVPCPTCRRQTKVTNPSRPVDEWANQMKPSFVIQGLTESFGPGTKDTDKCSLCHEGGETTPAIAWCSVCDVSLCQGCLTAHGRIPSSKHHVVTDLSPETKVQRKRKIACTEHKDEFIKFYCKGCKKTLCQTCCILYHRKCDDVVLLEAMVPEMKLGIRNRKEMVASKLQEKATMLTNTKKVLSDAEQNKTSMQSQVRSTCQRVIDEVKKKKKKLMEEIENVTEKQMIHLKARLKTTEMVIQNWKQDISMMNHVLESEGENDLYDFWQSFNINPLESSVDTDADLSDSEIPSRINLMQDIDKLSKNLEEINLGEIDVRYEVGLDLSLTPVLIDTIDVHLTDDHKDSYATDVTVLDVNGIDAIVVTDRYSNSVKSFYRRGNQQCHSKLNVKSNPWNLTQIKPNTVAITMPNAKQIVIVEVNPDLKLLSTMATKLHYHGITSLTSTTIAVCSSTPPRVDVLDLTGNVLRSINQLDSIQALKIPRHLGVTTKGNILVSDVETNSLLCLKPEGDVVFNYQGTGNSALKNPKVITVLSTGDILLADWTLGSVFHLTESGQFVREVLKSDHGVRKPHGLSVDKYGQIYVSLQEGDVKIFRLTK